MTFSRGNLAVRDHAKNGRELLLFQLLGKGRPVRYLGEFACTSWREITAPDTDGNPRSAIVFHLIPDTYHSVDIAAGEDEVYPQDMEMLRQRAFRAAEVVESESGSESKRTYYRRSRAVRDYVLARANGICECCGDPAPFKRENGSDYLEPHHIKRRSDFGPDHPRWVAGICPNCHRKIHFGAKGNELNERLTDTIGRLEEHSE